MAIDEFTLLDDRIKAAAEARREALVRDQLAAGARGDAMLAAKEPYRPLSEPVKARIISAMAAMFPRDDVPAPKADVPPHVRAAEASLARDRANFEAAPNGDPRRGDHPVELNHPAVFTVPEFWPTPGDTRSVFFRPVDGRLVDNECPPGLPQECRPYPLELPGSNWPWWDERGLADLGRVRWARGRPTIWLPTADSPTPE